jgi:RNA polymerase sigma factor (sigma-70 family)
MSRTDFNELVHQLSRKLYGYALRILQNQEEAEDAVQEVFIKLWRMGEKLNVYLSIEALAITMTKNYCIDIVRKRKRMLEDERNEAHSGSNLVPTPYEQLEKAESGEILCSIINKLPETYREIVKLRELDGLSYEEVAEITDQNINTLRVNISRARRIIRDEYNKYQNERRKTEHTAGKVL